MREIIKFMILYNYKGGLEWKHKILKQKKKWVNY